MSLINPQEGLVPLSSFAAVPDRAFSRSRPRVLLQPIFQALAVRVPQSLVQQSPGPESRPWRGATPWRGTNPWRGGSFPLVSGKDKKERMLARSRVSPQPRSRGAVSCVTCTEVAMAHSG